MNSIVSTQTLKTQGFNAGDIARMSRRGELIPVRRGAYARDGGDDLVREARHRRLIDATAHQLVDGSIVSHGSAAVLHRLPVWSEAIARVHVTRSRTGNGKRRTVVHVHGAPLHSSDVTVIDGIHVTSLARTVLDLGRTLSMEQAVAAGDRALANHLSRAELNHALARMERWPGVRRARQVVGFLDVRSESVGESLSRVRFHQDGLPAPEPQYELIDADGVWVARVDFFWRQQRTVGEFDGKIKYGPLLRAGQSLERVLVEEKLREDRIRDLDLRVVRWTWRELHQPGVIRDRLQRAFARASPDFAAAGAA